MTNEGFLFCFVVDEPPNPNHGGAGVTANAVIASLVEQGHRVIVIALGYGRQSMSVARQNIKNFEELGATGFILPAGDKANQPRALLRVRSILGAKETLFPGYLQASYLRNLLHSLSPDGVIAYHWNALAALSQFSSAPIFGLVGDPAHLARRIRQSIRLGAEVGEPKLSLFRKAHQRFLIEPRLILLQRALLGRCAEAGAFAAHHAAEFSLSGIACTYYRTPVPRPRPTPLSPGGKKYFRILMIGHLRGAATLAGISLFARETLPALLRLFPHGTLDIRIVGGFVETLPNSLFSQLALMGVTFVGQVAPPDEEFNRADVVIVPTPIELGNRVRILVAFSFGKVVVAHKANARGIPELTHETNCFLASNGLDIAVQCLRIFNDEDIASRVAQAATATFENQFSIETAGTRLARKLVELARTTY